MRILLYNWAPSGSPIDEGGGVALYLDNLVDGLLALGHTVHVLSSGFLYSVLNSHIRIQRRSDGRKNLVYFDLINSPVTAPSFFMFDAPARMVDCPELVATVRSFMARNGPYDVFHIQNVEGLSFDVLSLAEDFSDTRFILTNHNYHVICQQANLWRQDKVRCTDYEHGANCCACNVVPIDMDEVMIDRLMRFRRLDKGSKRAAAILRRTFRAVLRLRRALRFEPAWSLPVNRRLRGERHGPADMFRLRRREAIAQVNAHCFRVLSVSKATEKIMLDHGLDRDISRVSYIGTRHYKGRPLARPKAVAVPLKLAFLGYTRPDKGFHLLASAIETMPKRLFGRLSLVVAARVSDPAALARIKACRGKFHDLDIRDGYTQTELPTLLKSVDLGLVLPQWDDALPQVAIEFICYGVPILTTDRGGQQELAGDEAFIFKADSTKDFWAKIEHLADRPDELARFWTLPRPLRANAEHIAELLSLYAGEDLAPSARLITEGGVSTVLPRTIEPVEPMSIEAFMASAQTSESLTS